MRKYNTAIFVHGCFWHRHVGCKYAYTPNTRSDFWENKFKNNTTRDAKVKDELCLRKIKCLIIWECTIKQMKTQTEFKDVITKKIEEFFRNDCLYLEL